MSKAAAWLRATRPRTLAASAAPVLVGLALAARRQPLDVPIAAVTLACALLLQVAANFANDYFDWARGVDTEHRLGPLRVVAAGLVSPGEMRAGLACVLAAAVALGAFLVAEGGWPIDAIGAAAVLCAVAYSAGPALASRGLGEVLVLAFFGAAAVGGTYWLQAGELEPGVLVVAVAVASPATALIVVNNLRDIETDRAAGKRTLAVRIGASATRVEYALLLAAAFAACALAARLYGPGVLLAMAAAPLALVEIRHVRAREGAALNASLAGTARLQAILGLLLAAGLWL